MITNIKSNVKGMGSFIIVFNGTTKYEYPGVYGISHLIEHCMCNQIKQIEEDLLADGLSYNASTSYKFMKFYISGLDKAIKKYRDKFYDLIINYEIPKDVFERERGIIITEYISSLSNQASGMFQNFFRKFLNRPTVIGDLENLKTLTYEDFINFKNKYFNKPSEIVSISNYPYENTNIEFVKKSKWTLTYPISTYNYTSEKYGSFDSNRIILFYDFISDSIENKFEKITYMKIFNAYMNDGLSSPLYKDIREKLANVYAIQTSVSSFSDTDFVFSCLLMTPDEHVNEVKAALIKTFKYHINHLSKRRFNKILKKSLNEIKTSKYLNYADDSCLVDSIKYYEEALLNKEITFDTFSKFANEFISNNEFKIVLDNEL